MKRFYYQFRIMLITFALGLASVFAYYNTWKFSDEIYVNLPETASGEVIVVFPRCRFQIPDTEGGGGVETRLTDSRGIPFIIEKHLYKQPERLTECVENQNSNRK
ncbi:MAG: hypothetical protein M3525_08685 [Acidobacteriota bacterium]|nr:hypothetical protein [Acidobacteriota bacterium]